MLGGRVQQGKTCADRVGGDALGIKPQRTRHCPAHRAKAADPGRFHPGDATAYNGELGMIVSMGIIASVMSVLAMSMWIG